MVNVGCQVRLERTSKNTWFVLFTLFVGSVCIYSIYIDNRKWSNRPRLRKDRAVVIFATSRQDRPIDHMSIGEATRWLYEMGLDTEPLIEAAREMGWEDEILEEARDVESKTR